jgi:hypothetical protein
MDKMFMQNRVTMSVDNGNCTVPEFIDSVLAKTSPKRSFSLIENQRFGLVFFAKTGSINSGTVHICVGALVHIRRKIRLIEGNAKC